jgi:hypothetical protein
MLIGSKNKDLMDHVECFGDYMGDKIHPKRPWLVKAVVMSLAIVLLSGGIVVAKVVGKITDSKS